MKSYFRYQNKVLFSFLIIASSVMLWSCNGNNDLSDAYGNFEAVEVIVSSMAQGTILKMDISEGQLLQEGQLIGWIDTTDLVLRKEQLQRQRSSISSRIANVNAQIKVQEQQLKNTLTDHQRIQKLFAEGAATQKQFDDINGAADLVREQISATRTQKQGINDEIAAMDMQIRQVEEMISDCYIVNPLNGTVLTKLTEEGEVASYGKPLYKIADLDILKLKVYVSGAQLPNVRLGQKVQVLVDRDENSNRALDGTVSWISESAEFTPKTIQTKEERVNLVYAVKVDVKNDGSLKIGMPGEVNFVHSGNN
ncbi:MAG: HlyD family efflux transporter periplasmic adaptor subunit [Bacteroidetes bacterium]|nr:HlyD family efflux transporter periplasmic adaptor subunit [Bacteroidota bacterium]